MGNVLDEERKEIDVKIAALLIALLMPASALAQAGHSHAPGEKHSHDAPKASAPAILPKKVVPATAVAPEYVQLAKNVEIIPNIEDVLKSKAAVLTHEGLFGPLLFAEQTRAFLIELKPGMFLEEHPHDIGSIVYTVRGKWVLASEHKRQVLETGSLFRFGDNMPTGWEAPFAEGALLLIVKPKGQTDSYEAFNKSITSMQATVDKDRKNGAVFYYNQLKPDHEAIAFARSVNPDFDDVLKIKY
jgi:quercetin dioxygenase-like cupin family protein